MRRIFFVAIIFVFLLLAGCISPDTNSPVTSSSASVQSDPQIHYGGSALAVSFSNDGISTTSQEAKEMFIKGMTYSTQYARYNESLEFFDAALAIDTNFSEAWIAKGVALHNMKRYDEAILSFNQALLISPDDTGTWHVKCITLNDAGRPGEAAECRKREADLDPSGYRNNTGVTVTPIPALSSDYLPTSVPEP